MQTTLLSDPDILYAFQNSGAVVLMKLLRCALTTLNMPEEGPKNPKSVT